MPYVPARPAAFRSTPILHCPLIEHTMLVLRVFLPFAAGYLLSYVIRVVNAVIAPDLIRDLGLTAADLGLLTSAAFFAFAVSQLPVGLMLDRFGPRKTESALLLVAALGAVLFSTATSAEGLILGRALMGLGTAACLMAAFKASSFWFPADRLPLINGFQMAAGGLGAMTGTVPVEAALGLTDWRGVFLGLAAVSVAIAGFIFFAVPPRDRTESHETLAQQLAGIRTVFTDRYFWCITPVTIAGQSAFLSIQSLWAGPWLRDVAGLPRDAVVDHLLLIAVAMVAGFVGMGWLGERLGRAGVPLMRVAVTGMALFIGVQGLIAFEVFANPLIAWMLFGFFGTAAILTYSEIPKGFPAALTGRAVTALNVLVFTGAFTAQWGIGEIIDIWSDGTAANPESAFAPEGYRAAFLVMIALQVAMLALYLLTARNSGKVRQA